MKIGLSKRFVSRWLLGTAWFIMAFSLWNAWRIDNPVWGIIGLFGGMLMIELHEEIEGRRIIEPGMFLVLLLTLLTIAISLALASLGLCRDVFGLLN